jgi:glucan phosphoethanolaminetransferase (alkaline phosphatase superfamily)
MWTGILLFTIHSTAKKLGKIEGKNNYINIFLLWLFLMMFSTSFKMLGWAIGNFQDINKYFYIQVGIIPDWLNLTMWGLFLFFGIIAMFLSFAIARRKEQARKIFITLLPIFYILMYMSFSKDSTLVLQHKKYLYI